MFSQALYMFVLYPWEYLGYKDKPLSNAALLLSHETEISLELSLINMDHIKRIPNLEQ